MRFSLFFCARTRCLCQATFFVLFIVCSLIHYGFLNLEVIILSLFLAKQYWELSHIPLRGCAPIEPGELLFGFGSTFEIDFGQLVGFISAVIILVVIAQFVIVIAAIIAYHSIFGIRADRVASAL